MTATRSIRIAVSLLLCMICTRLAAQQFPVNVQVQTVQPVSVQLANLYTGTQARLIITLLNTDLQKPVLHVRLRLNIKGTSVSLRNRDYGYYPDIALEAGLPVQLSLNDLAPYFNMDNLEVSGIPRYQLQQSGKLPDGFYSFCVEVVEVSSGQIVSNTKLGCAPPAWIATSQPPLLNLPRKGEAVAFREPLNIVFNWTPRHMASPNAAFQTEYEFTLVELWDTGILPEAAFGTMPPLYQTTTNSTTMLYGPAEPPLLPGRQYAWRIRAKAKMGADEFDIFQNNGYSEIFYFVLQEDCQPPQQVAATITNGQVSITWTPQPKMTEYIVEYREQDKDNASWFNVKSNTNEAVIRDAIPGHSYEYRVGGFCTPGNKTLGELHGFDMPAKDSSNNKNCGLLPDIKLANQEPIKELLPDDQITAGDFPVRLLNVKGGGGTFSGHGYITIPLLGHSRVKVKFDNIKVNTNRQLMDGVIMTTFDSLKTQVADVDSVLSVISDFASVINDLAHLAIDHDYLAIKELTEQIKEMAEQELPDELKDRIIKAVDNLEQAKQEYDEAKKEYDAATTPEQKAAAKEKMDAAEQKFNDAKKEVEAVNKEKEKLVEKVSEIILQAVKNLGKEAEEKVDASKEQYEQQGNQLDGKALMLGAGQDTSALANVLIIADDEEELDIQQETNTSIKAFAEQHMALVTSKLEYGKLQFSLALYKQFTSRERLELVGKILQGNGKTLIVNINSKLVEGQTTDQVVAYTQAQILEFITQLIVSE